MSILELYLLFVALPSIKSVFLGGSMLCIVALVCALASLEHAPTPITKLHRNIIVSMPIACIVCFVLSAFAPTKKEVAMIVSGSYMMQQPHIEKLPGKAVALLNKYLDAALSED